MTASGAAALTPQAAAIIGKTDAATGTSMPLIQHLLDTGHTAALLWDEWLPRQTKEVIAASFGGNHRTARTTFVMLAGVHDIGKATPAFCLDKEDCRTAAVAAGLPMHGMDGVGKGSYHSITGQLILEQHLRNVHGASPKNARALGLVIGSHHGTTPDIEGLREESLRPHHSGLNDPLWTAVQTELLDVACRLLGIPTADIKAVAAQGLTVEAQVILSGAVIMADWLASDTENFPVVPSSAIDLSDARARKAWASLTLPAAWQPSTFDTTQQGLDQRFATATSPMTVRPFQDAVVQAARQHQGLIIVEAPMGEGKTEAALLAAETIAARTGAGGVFVALPTQATSNSMFSRALTWLGRTTGEDEASVRSVYLAHSKAMLNAEFTGLIGSDRIVAAHRWMTGRKRGVLAPFVVGTIDQILSGALRQKHLPMHHMALANKVVILDEVHAVDTYMGSYLHKVLEWLGAYNVPVFALSATLPSAIRKELMESYDRSRGTAAGVTSLSLLSLAAQPPPATASGSPAADYSVLEGYIGYPVVSASDGGRTPLVAPVRPDPARNLTVRIEQLADDTGTLIKTLDQLLADGGCAAIIRNTVARAQETYRALKDTYGADNLILIHSRFVGPERIARERDIMAKLGPDKSGRPQRLIVIGTQVLEQSLDIDVDVLIADMAPMDVVLQRVGRLHRHAATVRPLPLAVPACYLTGVDWGAEIPGPVKGARFPVYPNALMYRSLATLLRHTRTVPAITLPAAISVMVQDAYAEDFMPPASWNEVWEKAQESFRKQERKSLAKASQHQLDGRTGQGDTMAGFANRPSIGVHEDAVAAAVRDIDPSYEVVLLKDEGDGALRTLDSLPEHAEMVVSTDVRPGRRAELTAAASTVNVPAYSLDLDGEEVHLRLGQNYPGWRESTWLHGRLLVVLDSTGLAFIGGRVLEYSAETGLKIS